MSEYTETIAYRTAATMAERVARATGRETYVEAVGGGMYAAVTVTQSGTVVVVTDEGLAEYADILAWENGAEHTRSDAGDLFASVATATEWIRENVTVTVTRAQADFLHSLVDMARDDDDAWADMHPGVDADDVLDILATAMGGDAKCALTRAARAVGLDIDSVPGFEWAHDATFSTVVTEDFSDDGAPVFLVGRYAPGAYLNGEPPTACTETSRTVNGLATAMGGAR